MNIIQQAISDYKNNPDTRYRFYLVFLSMLVVILIILYRNRIIDKSVYEGSIIIMIAILLIYFISMIIGFLYGDYKPNKQEIKHLNAKRIYVEGRRNLYEKIIQNRLNKNYEKLKVKNDRHNRDPTTINEKEKTEPDQKIKTLFEEAKLSSTFRSFLNPIEYNLEKQIRKEVRNSIINLIIGMIATIAAIFVLTTTILYPKVYTNLNEFIIFILPRITFVTFIQIFAFFFLKLYKKNLEDGKYYLNELTNINCKIAAINLSRVLKKDEILNMSLKDLILVERNFKLGEKESLLTIEKGKLENYIDEQTMNSIKDSNVWKDFIAYSKGKSN